MADSYWMVLIACIISFIVGLLNPDRGTRLSLIWWGLYLFYIALFGVGLIILISKTWSDNRIATTLTALQKISLECFILGVAICLPYIVRYAGAEIRVAIGNRR